MKIALSWSTDRSIIYFRSSVVMVGTPNLEAPLFQTEFVLLVPKIGKRAFLLIGDEPKLTSERFYYQYMSLFLWIVLFNHSMNHSMKVKSNFGEACLRL